ncbi:MAG: diaminopimelate decarboxylase, partial [Anaerolineae bacterium]|nr:diaminopimelate decarboxylase [Anaerolineae bacterium]
MKNLHTLPSYCLPDALKVKDGEFAIQDVPLVEILEQFGTPLYVYDSLSILHQIEQLQTHFTAFSPFYSVKANNSLAIAQLIAQSGLGAELASGGEITLAKQAGFSYDQMTFAGPGKTDAELTAAIDAGIKAINAESVNEIKRINDIAKRLNKKANVCIRVNLNSGTKESPEIMTGLASKFGIDEDEVFDVVDPAAYPHVDFLGYHVYTASQILSIGEIADNFRLCLAFAEKWLAHGWPLRLISFGGGFGIPYNADDTPLDMPQLAAALEGVKQVSPLKNREEVEIVLELGRYIVGHSGMFITTVLDVKESKGEHFIITDGGINAFHRPKLMNLNHPSFVLEQVGQVCAIKASINGPLCTPIDVIAVPDDRPNVEVGDHIIFLNAGAYGYSLS